MDKLTNSNIERQNILNNKYALEHIQEYIGLPGLLFEGEYRFTKQMVADFFEIDTSTIDRYLEKYTEELKHNGYILSRGKQLNEFKIQFAHLIDKASKTTQLAAGRITKDLLSEIIHSIINEVDYSEELKILNAFNTDS